MGRQGGTVTSSCALSRALSRGRWDLWSVICARPGGKGAGSDILSQPVIGCGFPFWRRGECGVSPPKPGTWRVNLKGRYGFWYGQGSWSWAPGILWEVMIYWWSSVGRGWSSGEAGRCESWVTSPSSSWWMGEYQWRKAVWAGPPRGQLRSVIWTQGIGSPRSKRACQKSETLWDSMTSKYLLGCSLFLRNHARATAEGKEKQLHKNRKIHDWTTPLF